MPVGFDTVGIIFYAILYRNCYYSQIVIFVNWVHAAGPLEYLSSTVASIDLILNLTIFLLSLCFWLEPVVRRFPIKNWCLLA